MGNSPSFPLENFPGDPGPWGVFDESTNNVPKGYGPVLYHKNNKSSNKDSKSSTFKIKDTLPTGENNVVDIFINATDKTKVGPNGAKRGGNVVVAGYRKLKKIHFELEDVNKPDGKKFEKLEFENKYTWVTAENYRSKVFFFAKGMEEFTKDKSGNGIGIRNSKIVDSLKREKVVVYAETQIDWLACALGSLSRGCPIVTIYATLGEEGALFAMNQTKASVVVVDSKLLKVLVTIAPKLPNLKYVFTIGDEQFLDKSMLEKLRALPQLSSSNFGCIKSVQETIEMGKSLSLDQTNADPVSGAIINKLIKEKIPVKSEDLAVLMYTSGTTGPPKAVKMSHGNFVAVLVSAGRTLSVIDIVSKNEKAKSGRGIVCGLGGGNSESDASTSEDSLPENVYMACLPMAHIMELSIECVCINAGIALAYGNPHTLTAKGIKLKTPESQGDASLAKPTVMALPPAILEKVYASVCDGVKSKGGLAQYLFDTGIAQGSRFVSEGEGLGSNSLLNRIVFKTPQQLLGGRVKVVASGSAPLAPQLHRDMQTILNVPIRIGYGLTETMAISSVGEYDDFSFGVCGPPTESAMIRLADWEEGNYMNSDVFDKNIGMPRGEILIGGPLVTQGYFVDESEELDENARELMKKNKEEFITFEDLGVKRDGEYGNNIAFYKTSNVNKGEKVPVRWFRTGDIGQINRNGVLQIIDRKKDLWKGPQGEYVSFSKVENILKLIPEIDNAMVYGKTGGSYCVLLVVPNPKAFKEFLVKSCGKSEEELSSGDSNGGLNKKICEDEKVVGKLAGICVKGLKEAKLAAFEIPQKMYICWDPWTPENELLTAQLKLKRPQIVKAYKAEIDKMYA